jgi:CBS domain-containing protein
MLVVDASDRLRGLVTSSDVERITAEAKSLRKPSRDSAFRLVVGAAVSPVRKSNGDLDRDKIITHIGNLVDEAIDYLASIRATPCLFIAPRYESAVIYGFYKEFDVNIAYSAVSECSLQVEGLT